MKAFDIGAGVTCDPDLLLNTRLLIQANSGAGKSWALRRLLEQTSGQVQQIVIDPEGEFATLRERFDYVLAAKTGGDTLADPRTAKLLAERLLELGVSAVLDIYELKAHERVRFVRLFLEALVDAPKKLWHPALIVLDEAHIFAPEKGSAESLQAVIDLSTRGRKRGFCLVQATQRLSKLHKDAAAEMNNKLIGRSALDVDMERAGDELGLTKAGRQVLRDLDAGEFFAFGPALTRTVTRVKVGPVQTSHPKAGSKLAGVVPPPTDRVRAVLSKLADLPAEAEQRERTVAEMKARIAELERDAKAGNKITAPAAPAKTVEILTDADRELLRKAGTWLADHRTFVAALVDGIDDRIRSALTAAIEDAERRYATVAGKASDDLGVFAEGRALARLMEKLARVSAPPPATAKPHAEYSKTIPTARPVPPAVRNMHAIGQSADGVTRPQQAILNALAWGESMRLPTQRREKVAFLADASPASSGYANNLGALRTIGYIDYPQPGFVALTEVGRAVAQVDANAPASSLELQDAICAKLPQPQALIVRVVASAYPDALTRAQVAEQANASPSSSGFANNLGALRSLGLIDYPRQGYVQASPVLFIEGTR